MYDRYAKISIVAQLTIFLELQLSGSTDLVQNAQIA